MFQKVFPPKFPKQHCFVFHPGSLVVNYPYDDQKEGKSQYSQSPDDKIFRQMSLAYSKVTRHRCC